MIAGSLGRIARELRSGSIASDPFGIAKALGIHDPHVRQAAGLLVCCPSHAEKVPSCSIRSGTDGTIWCKCHACGWSGDAVSLVAAVRNLDTKKDFRAVLRELIEIEGRWDLRELVDGQARTRPSPRRASSTARPPPAPMTPSLCDARFDAIARALIEHCPLRAERDVAAFVDRRRIYADAEACDCGALPPRPNQHVLIGKLAALFGLDDLERAGLLSHDGVVVWPDHRLAIPWFDRDGRIVALQRRTLGAMKPKYVWTRERSPRAPFGADLFDEVVDYYRGDCEVIVTEGALDCFARRKIARHRKERAVVLAVPSASASADPALADLIGERTLVLSLDADAAGDTAACRIRNACRGHVSRILRERARGANDANEVLLAMQQDSQ